MTVKPPPAGSNEHSPLEAERSVPVTGFSRELRGAADVERYRFAFAMRGDSLSPVHIVYSASQHLAEVKTGDMKAFRVTEVASADEARTRFIAWWRAGHRKPGFVAPRRTGRVPEAGLGRPERRVRFSSL